MKKRVLIIGMVCILLIVRPLKAQTWGTAKRLTWNSGASLNPAIAFDSSNHIHLVWYDETPGNREIYYKKSTTGGDTWTTKRLTYNSGRSYNPVIALDSNNHIHLVWNDETPGNLEIYYKRDPTGNVGITEQGEAIAAQHRLFSAPLFFDDRITVSFDQFLKGPLRVVLYDISGVAVFSMVYASVPMSLSLEDSRILRLGAGVYFLRIESNEQTETQKLIKFK